MFWTILIVIIAFSALVLVHELGHFLTAKKFGIKVLEFGFGLPPRLIGKRIGETILSLNWLPFGGFVHLLGEDETDQKALGNDRSFAAQPVLKRIAVVVAGVAMNLLLSWVIFYTIIIHGDFKIIIPTPESLTVIDHVAANSPAEQAGLHAGDRILAINDTLVKDQADFIRKTRQNLGQEVKLAISDWEGNHIRLINLTPRPDPPAGQGAIGLSLSPYAFEEFKSPLEKVFSGPIYSYNLSKIIISSTGGLIRDLTNRDFAKASSQVAGPIGIVAVSNTILSNGLDAIFPYLYFVGLLSLNLSLINILPVPGLDGGRLLFLVIEAITRRRTNPAIEKYIHSVGLALLLSLIILISISDVNKFILKH